MDRIFWGSGLHGWSPARGVLGLAQRKYLTNHYQNGAAVSIGAWSLCKAKKPLNYSAMISVFYGDLSPQPPKGEQIRFPTSSQEGGLGG